MKPVLEDLFMGPMASPSFSEGFRWEDSRRRVRVIFADVTIADSKRVMLLHEWGLARRTEDSRIPGLVLESHGRLV